MLCFDSIPFFDDGISEDALAPCPTVHQIGSVGVFRNDDIAVPCSLNAEHIDLGIDFFAVFLNEFEHIDVAAKASISGRKPSLAIS